MCQRPVRGFEFQLGRIELSMWIRAVQKSVTVECAGVYNWRDEVARTEDESPSYVLPKAQLVKLSQVCVHSNPQTQEHQKS